jgi:hypothetical protein
VRPTGEQRLHPGDQHLQADECGDGLCEITQDTYTCPVSAQTTTTASNCPANVYCLGSNCFNTSYTNDADFARSMSLMEAAREAGVYLDTTNMQVFKGEGNRCRDRLLQELLLFRLGWRRHDQPEPVRYGFATGLRRADERREPRVPLPGHAGLLMSGGFQRQLHHLWRHRRHQRHGTAGQARPFSIPVKAW